MQFGLSPNTKGQWVVEVDAIEGSIYFVVVDQNQTVICNSSVGG
jgi:hypothetical protein